MSGCRNPAPAEVCRECRKANDGCTGYCRDAFVYSPDGTDAEIVEHLKENYAIGGKEGGWEIGVKVPERILALLASTP